MGFLHLVAKLLVITAWFTVFAGGVGDWSYRKPEDASTWKYHFEHCAGHKQSPINIVPKETIFDAGLKDLAVNFEHSVSASLQNNGHTVQATFKTGKSNISGGYLESQFRAVQMHFHWGSVDSHGSEHQVSGHKYPMEIHIVHFNAEKYPNISIAMKKQDGLAVLGILVEVGATNENPVIKPIVDTLNATHFKGDTAFVSVLEPRKFLPQDIQQYYTYKGSLTTPGCYESVQWFVFNHTFKISFSQLESFRKLSEGTRQNTKNHNLEDNFRPVQPLYGRNVTRSFKKPPFGCSKISNTTMECFTLVGDKVVFYEAVVNLCTLPAAVTLYVSQPEIGFKFEKTVYSDIGSPQKIGNLDYGFTLEFHSHFRETQPSTLHITIKDAYPLSSQKQQEVISADFDESACQLGKCLQHSCNKHWCFGTAFGFKKQNMLYIGFSSTFKHLTAANPLVDVNFYRNESGKWHLTDSATFANNEEKKVHLTGVMVHNDLSTKHKRGFSQSPQWEYVTFKAKISKTADSVLYQLLMVPTDGLYYRVLKDEFTLACVKPVPEIARLSDAGKIAIGVSVVSMILILGGITMALLYCRRKQYTRHEATLVDEMEDGLDDKL